MSTNTTTRKKATLLADTQKALRAVPTAFMRQYEGDWYVAVPKDTKVADGLVLVKVARTRSFRLAIIEAAVATIEVGGVTYTCFTSKEVNVTD
jgi:hypothetical protein